MEKISYGLVGHPLGQSYSVLIHQIFKQIPYQLCELTPAEFSTFIKERNFKGLNITIPYKTAALDLCDGLEESVIISGSLNTIVNDDGRLIGYNTDLLGLKWLLSAYQIDLAHEHVMILGTGGTSKTALALAKMHQALSITQVSRTAKPKTLTYKQLKGHPATVVINTTPVGMAGFEGSMEFDLTWLPQVKIVVDVIYNPYRTNLILQAQALKLRAYNGLLMLVAQAYFATKLFTQKELETELIKSTYLTLAKAKTNIVLIGLPGSGKSTIGQGLGLNKEFVDFDQLIEARTGLTILEIFKQYSEEHFRDLETALIKELSLKTNLVIACGGGVIERPINITYLKQNGFLFYLKKTPEQLNLTYKRPLVNDLADLKALAKRREPLYQQAADYTITHQPYVEMIKEIEELYETHFDY